MKYLWLLILFTIVSCSTVKQKLPGVTYCIIDIGEKSSKTPVLCTGDIVEKREISDFNRAILIPDAVQYSEFLGACKELEARQ